MRSRNANFAPSLRGNERCVHEFGRKCPTFAGLECGGNFGVNPACFECDCCYCVRLTK